MLSTGVMPIPCPHFKITLVKRSQGQSAVAWAAYQSGEQLFSEYDQKTKFYNKKKEPVHAEITADAISDRIFEGVVTSISSAGTTSGGTTTYPVTIRIDDTGSLMPGMNATAALDIPPCRRYVIVKATAGFAVFRLILKSLLFYSCLDFTQNLGKTHFCLTFGVHFSIRSLFFGIFFNVFAIGIYRFDSCFLSTAWTS